MPLCLLLVVRLAIGMLFSLSVPIWESFDEDGHFAYAHYLVKHHTLPRVGDPEAEKIWERIQPPLYYLILAPVIAPFDLGDKFPAPERNPYLVHGDGGYNYALHPERLTLTARSIDRAVRAARVASVLFTTVSVLAIYGLGLLVWPTEPRTAWAAACLYAFWPQLLFTGSMVSNDVLVTALSALVFYLGMRLAADGFRLRPALTLGAALGAALLTKLNAIALIPIVAVALLMGTWRARRWKSSDSWLAVAGILLIVAAATWLLTSFEFVTTHLLRPQSWADFVRQANPELSGMAQPRRLLIALEQILRTFVAAFGWGNLEAPDWLYWAWALAASGAAIGLTLIEANKDRPALPTIIALAVCQAASSLALILAVVVAQRSLLPASGRYLLPALPAVVVLLISGWRALVPRHRWPLVRKALCVAVLGVGWSIPVVTLMPAYAKPRPVAADAPLSERLSMFFGEHIELIGYQRATAEVSSQAVRLTLCWQAVEPVPQNYSLLLELVGSQGRRFSQLETYPGRGNYPTTLWEARAPFCDQYILPAGKNLELLSKAHVQVSMLAGVQGEPLPVKNAAGDWLGHQVQIPISFPARE